MGTRSTYRGRGWRAKGKNFGPRWKGIECLPPGVFRPVRVLAVQTRAIQHNKHRRKKRRGRPER